MSNPSRVVSLMVTLALMLGSLSFAQEGAPKDEHPTAAPAAPVAPDAPAAQADPAPAPAPAKPEEKPEELFVEEFTEASLDSWTSSNGVVAEDIKDGHLAMNNQFKADAPTDQDPTASLVYSIGEVDGDIDVEVKYDDFLPNPSSCLRIQLATSVGATVLFARQSSTKQELQYQVVDGKLKTMKSMEFTENKGFMKLHLSVKTGELEAFYKVNAEDPYKALPESKYTLETMKEGPFILVVACHNFSTGGPAGVKLDSIKVTSPKATE